MKKEKHMSDMGKQGGKAPSPVKPVTEGGTPKTGFDSAPRGDSALFENPKGFGGSNKGAH